MEALQIKIFHAGYLITVQPAVLNDLHCIILYSIDDLFTIKLLHNRRGLFILFLDDIYDVILIL